MGRVLTPRAIERKLLGFHPYLKNGSWNKRLTAGLRLDLSRVEWADLGAMAQICLLVEGALRHGIPCWVALPYPNRRPGEQRWLDSLESDPPLQLMHAKRIDTRVVGRERALRFMHHCEFRQALRPAHVPRVDDLMTVTADHDGGAAPEATDRGEGAAAGGAVDTDDAPPAVAGVTRRVFALQWLTSTDAVSLRAWEEEAVTKMAQRGAVLSRADAEAVVGVVLRELIANVNDHAREMGDGASCPPASLVGAVAVRHAPNPYVAVGDRQATADYGEWVESTRAPVLRLVVGDSGRGICGTLDLPEHDHPPDPPGGREWTRNERILFWSLTPFSSSRTDLESAQGVRGLASVRRAVADACGALVLRSADAQAGYAYPRRRREPLDTHPKHLAGWPGTFVDIALAPTAEPRAILGVATGDSLRVAAVRPLRQGAGRIDLDGIRKPIPRAAEAEDQLVVLTGTLRGEPEELYSDAVTLLGLSEELSDHASLVLLCLDQVSTELAPILRELDDLRTQRREHAAVPLMVLDKRGSADWLGVGERPERLLSALTRPGHTRVERMLASELLDVPPERLGDEIGRLGRWILEDQEGIGLRITPASIAPALADAVRDQIGSADRATESEAGAGEALVTPTLATVRRWIDVRRLIELAGGERLVGHVLGVNLARTIGEEPDLAVLSVGDVPRELERAFRSALGARGRVIHLRGETGRSDDPSAPFVVAKSRFVCLTDAVVTSNHVRHAVHDLVRAGAEPLAVATVLDAREEASPLTALGRSLDVNALAHVPLIVHPDPGTRLVPIQPLQGGATRSARQPRPKVKVPEDDMLDWCERIPDSLITGHVARATRRHFTTYLDVRPLLADDAFSALTSRHVTDIVERWRSAADPPLERLVIAYPRGENVNAARFASLTKEAWGARRPSIDEVMPLKVVTQGARRVLAVPGLLLEKGTGVIVCDWGAVTLHMLYDLVHAAAELGASSILALGLSSQLRPEDEHIAARLEAVRGRSPRRREPSGSTPPLPPARDPVDSDLDAAVPVRVEFLSRFPVGYETPGECANCRYAREYVDIAARGSVPLLSAHAEQLAEELEPTELETAQADPPRDALGKAITHAEAVAIVRFRERVRAARDDTMRRIELHEEIKTMSAEDVDAAVRALALELRWLKLPPLRFDSLREVLAERLEARLTGRELPSQSASLQRQYVIVLRAVSKDRFLARVPQLLASALRGTEGAVVAAQVLEGVHSLARRSYRGADDLRRASVELNHAADQLAQDRALAATSDSLEVQEAISMMVAEIDYRRELKENPDMTAVEAWLRLRVDFFVPVTSHRFETNVEILEASVRLPRMRTADEWREMLAIWRGVQQLLVARVLPRLRLVHDIVVAYSQSQNWEAPQPLARAASVAVIKELGEVERLITSFVEDPASAPLKRDEFEMHMRWWHRFFFADDGHGLLEALRNCPCLLRGAVAGEIASTSRAADEDRELRELHVEVPDEGPDFGVFAHDFVITKVVHHALLNARQIKHGVTGATVWDPVRARVDVFEEATWGVVRIRNDGTRRTEAPGQGLVGLERLIGAYGGTLTIAEAEAPWTFDITARFQKWKEYQ